MLALQLLAFVGAVQCLPWDGVKPTGVVDQPLGLQEPPKTTQAARLELHRRQAAGDATCGYYDKISSAAVYCLSQYSCATNSLGAWGCCSNLDNCWLPTACIDSTALSNYASSYLANNPWVFACTHATEPLCITQYMENKNYEYTGFLCGSSDDYLTETYYTTAANATVPSPTFYNAFYNPSKSTSSTSTFASPTTSTLPPPTPLSSSSPSSSSSPTQTPGSTPAPIGAIVGGVVGGIAAIAIVGLIIFFLRRRNKKPSNGPQPQYPVAAQMQQTPGPPTQPAQMYPQPPQQYEQYQQYPSNAYPPAQNYPPAVHQTAYPEKPAPQETSYPVYGTPQLAHNEPTGAGLEQRMSAVPPYSPDPSSAGGFDSKNDATQPVELSEQNR